MMDETGVCDAALAFRRRTVFTLRNAPDFKALDNKLIFFQNRELSLIILL